MFGVAWHDPVAPQVPPGPLHPDLGGSPALIATVVPLPQIGVGDHSGEASQFGRTRRALCGARERGGDVPRRQVPGQCRRGLLAPGRQRDVGASGVLERLAPCRLAVPDQYQLTHRAIFSHAALLPCRARLGVVRTVVTLLTAIVALALLSRVARGKDGIAVSVGLRLTCPERRAARVFSFPIQVRSAWPNACGPYVVRGWRPATPALANPDYGRFWFDAAAQSVDPPGRYGRRIRARTITSTPGPAPAGRRTNRLLERKAPAARADRVAADGRRGAAGRACLRNGEPARIRSRPVRRGRAHADSTARGHAAIRERADPVQGAWPRADLRRLPALAAGREAGGYGPARPAGDRGEHPVPFRP